MIRAILAHDDKWGIGKSGTLPWPHNAQDLRWFKQNTTNSLVVMGRHTWNSLPVKPLPNRINIVVSSKVPKGDAHAVYSTDDIPKLLVNLSKSRYRVLDGIWVIGGAQLVHSSLPVLDEIWLNNIHGVYDCDTFLEKVLITRLFEPYDIQKTYYSTITKWKRCETIS